MTNNIEVSKIFSYIADMLEMKSENLFRIRAYRRAAQNIEGLKEDIADIAKRGGLEDIPGIGKDLAEKIRAFLKTGKVEFFEQLKKETPQGILDLMSVPGIGPKTARALFEKLKIKDIKDLEKKARRHKLSGLPGIKEKTEENILKGIEIIKSGKERMALGVALPIAEEIAAYLKKAAGADKIAICGSLRRQRETVRDIDILVTALDHKRVMDTFVSMPIIKETLAHGATKSSAILKEDIQADVRVVDKKSFGAALVYFTGSKEHNIHIRELAVKEGLKINEYGVFEIKTGRRLGGETEEEIYKILGLAYIPPELREDRGEIAAAAKGKLPRLIEIKDIKGDFHVHTKASDGSDSLEEIGTAAMARGYEYVLITDHSKTLAVAGGLTDSEILNEIKAIKRLNKTFKNFRFLAGTEVDISSDGSLGFSDRILAELDIVVAAVHMGFKQSKERITKRIIRAMDNKYVNIISHLTGRLLGKREGYPVDLEQILKAARDTNTALEINAFPQRLDLDDTSVMRAKELGVMLSIGTDTHSVIQLENMWYGVSVARRGWLEAKNVLNTFSAEKVLKKIKKR